MNPIYNLNVNPFRNINSIKPVPPTHLFQLVFLKAVLLIHDKYIRLMFLKAQSIF